MKADKGDALVIQNVRDPKDAQLFAKDCKFKRVDVDETLKR